MFCFLVAIWRARSSTRRRGAHILEIGLLAAARLVGVHGENDLNQLAQGTRKVTIGQGIPNLAALIRSDDETAAPQARQMVGHIGSGQSEVRRQLTRIANAIQQRDENSAPCRIGQRPAQPGQRRFPHLTCQHLLNSTVFTDIRATVEISVRLGPCCGLVGCLVANMRRSTISSFKRRVCSTARTPPPRMVGWGQWSVRLRVEERTTRGGADEWYRGGAAFDVSNYVHSRGFPNRWRSKNVIARSYVRDLLSHCRFHWAVWSSIHVVGSSVFSDGVYMCGAADFRCGTVVFLMAAPTPTCVGSGAFHKSCCCVPFDTPGMCAIPQPGFS